MKRALLISLLLVLASGFSFGIHNPAAGRFSLSDFKKALKSDSTDARNTELAREVLKTGVSFEYTAKREKDLREWGANDELIAAIWQSIVDETDEGRMFGSFMKSHKSDERETRKAAFEKGKTYLARFEDNERFRNNVARVRKEIGYLACEFDPDLGC